MLSSSFCLSAPTKSHYIINTKPLYSRKTTYLDLRYEGNGIVSGSGYANINDKAGYPYLFSGDLKSQKFQFTDFKNIEKGAIQEYIYRKGNFLTLIEGAMSKVHGYLVQNNKPIKNLITPRWSYYGFTSYKDFIYYKAGHRDFPGVQGDFLASFSEHRVIDNPRLKGLEIDRMMPNGHYFAIERSNTPSHRFYTTNDELKKCTLEFPMEIAVDGKVLTKDTVHVVSSDPKGTNCLLAVEYWKKHTKGCHHYNDYVCLYSYQRDTKQLEKVHEGEQFNSYYRTGGPIILGCEENSFHVYYFNSKVKGAGSFSKLTTVPKGYELPLYSYKISLETQAPQTVNYGLPILVCHGKQGSMIYIFGKGWKDLRTYLSQKGVPKNLIAQLKLERSYLTFKSEPALIAETSTKQGSSQMLVVPL
jgi:hypothetical protein